MNILNAMQSSALTPRRKKVGVPTVLFTLIFGGIFIFAGGVMMSDFVFTSDRIIIEGQVTDIRTSQNSDGETMYAPIVEYTVQDEVYEATTSFTSSNQPQIGDTYAVSYDPINPTDGKAILTPADVTFWLMAIFPLVGFLVAGGGVVAFVRSQLRDKEIQALIHGGRMVTGVLLDIRVQQVKNSTSSYNLVVAATDATGQVKEYVSDKVAGVPAGLIGMDIKTAAVPIDVYIDPSNPDKYYVDLSDIPSLTPDRIGELIKHAQSKTLN